LALCVAALFAVAAGLLPHSPGALRAAVAGYGAWAPAVCIVVWAALTPALFSGTILAGATGLLFGPALGTPIAIAGATLGGALAFTIARRFGAGAAEGLGGPRIARLRARVEGRAFRSVALLRIAPAVPTTLLN